MSKIQTINVKNINNTKWQRFVKIDLKDKMPQNLPQVDQVFQSDIDHLNEALKKQKNDKQYYAIIRYLLSQVKKSLGHTDYVNVLTEIGLSQLEGKTYIHNLKLKICQAIVDSQQYHRINILQNIINALTDLNLKDASLRARLEIVRAGKQLLKGNFCKASIFYLNASRQQAFIKDDSMKLALINKSIAFNYICIANKQSHRNICALCLNQTSQKSPLKAILDKLYMQDMMSLQDNKLIQKQLPSSLLQIDNDGLSLLDKAMFSHNIVPIRNTFNNIYLATLIHLLKIQSQQILLILLEKTFPDGKIKINQQQNLVEFKEETEAKSERVKYFFNRIDQILEEQK